MLADEVERLGLDGRGDDLAHELLVRGRRRLGPAQAHRLGRKTHVVVHIERASLVVGVELVVAARELHGVVPADADGEFAPLVVRVERQQRVVQVKQRKPQAAGFRSHSGSHVKKDVGARRYSDSNIVLSKGIVMARWVRKAKASSWSKSCMRLPRSREKRLSM
ncbi:hypothetical protein D3C71_1189580 [compost metagenome]